MVCDLGSAKLRFPTRNRAIDELAARDEDFRDLCLDFAAAETEVRKWQGSSAPACNERRAEYVVLVEDLAREIEATLDAAVIVRFPRR